MHDITREQSMALWASLTLLLEDAKGPQPWTAVLQPEVLQVQVRIMILQRVRAPPRGLQQQVKGIVVMIWLRLTHRRRGSGLTPRVRHALRYGKPPILRLSALLARRSAEAAATLGRCTRLSTMVEQRPMTFRDRLMCE